MELVMQKEKETKGTVRYQELDRNGNPVSTSEGASIGMLYIRKAALAEYPQYPELVKVTVERIDTTK